jgi:hypothetical protein
LQSGEYIAENVPDGWPQDHQCTENHNPDEREDKCIFNEALAP